MKLIGDLDELKIGDIVKIYYMDEQKKHDVDEQGKNYKIGEITHKWVEKNNPHFQLKIFETILPLSTERLIQRLAKAKNIVDYLDYRKRMNKCDNKDKIFRLDPKEKNSGKFFHRKNLGYSFKKNDY